MAKAKYTKTSVEWAPVDGFLGEYEVSNYGDVRSLSRIIRRKGCGEMRTRVRILRPCWLHSGYGFVDLSRGGQQHRAYIHHLVLAAFVGPRPPGQECCHEDDNPKNNWAGNLRWKTHQRNVQDMVKRGRSCKGRPGAKGEQNPRAKLTNAIVLDLRQRHAKQKINMSHEARLLCVDTSVVRDAVFGVTWKHL